MIFKNIYSYKVKKKIKYQARWQNLGPRLTKELTQSCTTR